MDYPEYEDMQADIEFGRYLLETIADIYGCDPTEQDISRSLYKMSDCGAWCKFTDFGIEVGTIVEGSDAEFSFNVKVSYDDEQLKKNFLDVVTACEELAEEAFQSADADQ